MSPLQCPSCRRVLDDVRAFPGATVYCECSKPVVVPTPTTNVPGPYRELAAREPVALRERPLTGPECPDCHRRLESSDVRGTPTLICSRCSGQFVDRRELLALLREARLNVTPDLSQERAPIPDTPYRACPLCSTVMHKRLMGPKTELVVDVCDTDGVWFDRRELDRALALASAQLLPSNTTPLHPTPAGTLSPINGGSQTNTDLDLGSELLLFLRAFLSL